MPKVVHFEIPADNLDRAQKFYADVFGWKIQKWEGGQMDYRLATTGEDNEMGINGAITSRGDDKCVVSIIGVPNYDEYVKKIESAGGKMLTPKMPVPSMGYSGYFLDSEGNRVGIFEPNMSAK